MKITIVFKNGYSFSVTCESFTLNKTLGEITGYEIKGIKDRKPLYISIEDIICVYRDIEAEEDNAGRNENGNGAVTVLEREGVRT